MHISAVKAAHPVPDGEMFTLSVRYLVYASTSLVFRSRFDMLANLFLLPLHYHSSQASQTVTLG